MAATNQPQPTIPLPHATSGAYLIVGAGHLAWHLAQVLERAGYPVVVASRNPAATAAAAAWPVPLVSYPVAAATVGDYRGVILAVPDNQIGPVSQALARRFPPDLPVFHTSGATPLARIAHHFRHRGVLWPIRSLRRGEAVADWRDLPLIYAADDPETREELAGLARALSDLSYALDDEQRAQLHLAAVFSNNFVTWLYQIAFELCAERDIPFTLLLPIIRATAGAQDTTPPALRQTGAAARGDTATMERHLALLEQPEYRELYRRMSRLIAAGPRS